MAFAISNFSMVILQTPVRLMGSEDDGREGWVWDPTIVSSLGPPNTLIRLWSHRMKRKIFRACVQSVLIYGTETWAMKAENLRSLERTERMMVRWMCGVSLKDRKRSEDLYSLLGIQSVAKVVRHGRLRWFGHVEHKNGDDWVSACRNVVMAGVRCVGRG